MAIDAIVDDLTTVDEKYHDLYAEKNGKFELVGVRGFKTQADVDRLSSALEKERNDHKQVRATLSVFGDRKIEDILADLDRIPELEVAAKGGKLDDAKIQELLEPKLKSKLAPLEREKLGLLTKVEELTKMVGEYQQKETIRTLHDAVRQTLSDPKMEGFQQTATDDVLMYAERMLEIVDGKVVTKDGVGVTPGIDATVWLTEMQQKKPHWWGPTAGGGSQGSRTTGPAASNPWSDAGWNMTEQGRIYAESPTRAAQMAKSAGTTVGGMRPVKK